MSALLLAGCGGGGSSSPDAGDATVYLLLSDAPSDDLASFELTITGLFLQQAGGPEGENLLGVARTVNLLDLATRSELLGIAGAKGGTFDGVRVAFDGSSIRARDRSGAPVPVAAAATSAIASAVPVLVLEGGRAAKLHLELPLDDALAPDPNVPGGLLYSPLAGLIARTPAAEPLDALHGVVLAENQSARFVRVRFFDPETRVATGDLTVALGGGTALLDEDGDRFATDGFFFGTLRFGDDVDVRSELATDGFLDATSIRIAEDSGFDVARIRGTIAGLDEAQERLALRIRTIDHGRDVVEPALAKLGDPAEIVVGYGNAKVRVGGEDPRSGDDGDLAIGQTVRVEFATFAGQPFAARAIELDDEHPELDATIVDDAAIPGAFVVNLAAHDPAVQEGLVASPATDVDVGLDGFEPIVLRVRGAPAVPASRLLEGVRLRLRGDLSGPPAAPQVAASRLEIEPGRLRGRVTAVNASLGRFTVDVDSIEAPFGGAALPDPVVVRFESAAIVEGDATSASGLFQLFGELAAGETLFVDVDGLADGSGGAGAWIVAAYVE